MSLDFFLRDPLQFHSFPRPPSVVVMVWVAERWVVVVVWWFAVLVWDLMQRPWLTRRLEGLLDPVMGKSLALYFRKGPA